MAIYGYKCKYGHAFDVLVRKEVDEPKACKVCVTKDIHKQLSSGHFNLRGEGFYRKGMS